MNRVNQKSRFSIYENKMTPQQLVEETVAFANDHIKNYQNETLMKISLLSCLPTTTKETQESMVEFARYTKTQMLDPVYCTELVGTLFTCFYQGKIDISTLSKPEQYLLADTVIDTKPEDFVMFCQVVGKKEILETVLTKTNDIEKSPYLLKQLGEEWGNTTQDLSRLREFQGRWIEYLKQTELPTLLTEAHYHEGLEEDLIQIGL